MIRQSHEFIDTGSILLFDGVLKLWTRLDQRQHVLDVSPCDKKTTDNVIHGSLKTKGLTQNLNTNLKLEYNKSN